MTPQVVQITLSAPPVGATDFRLRFSTTAADPWTPYSTATPTPTDPEALPLADLVSGSYTLDGINDPTGDMEAASAAGTWYEAAWGASGTWGNWSPVFTEVVTFTPPGSYPTAADLQRFLVASGLTLSPGLIAQCPAALSGAINDFEGAVEMDMLAGPESERNYDPPVNRETILFVPPLATVPTAVYQAQNGSPTPLVYGTDYLHFPETALAAGVTPDSPRYRCITGLRFFTRWLQPLWLPERQSIRITGRWGYGLILPADVVTAMLARAAWRLLPSAILGTVGAGGASGAPGILKQWTRAERSESFDTSIWTQLGQLWCGADGKSGLYGATVAGYKRMDI